jgi:hypothetical protein
MSDFAQKESNCMAEMSRDQVIARIDQHRQAVTDAAKHERHRNYQETMYWLNQYKLLANRSADLLNACLTLLRQQQEQTPKPLDHYWTPDPTKRFCVICGDNGLGSVWGVHRFQIQPHDPDFKPSPPAGDT